MKFTYKANTAEGRTITGTAEAANKQVLLALLRKQGLHPVLIQASKNRAIALFGSSKKIKLTDLVVFTRQLSTMISAGVPLARSLAALQDGTTNPYLHDVLKSITKDVESGVTLGEAFGKFPLIFNDVFVNMVKAGEEGGILDEILERLATQIEQDSSIRKKIKSAMMYPVVILSVTVIAFFGIMLFIVPKIGSILGSLGGPNAHLPIYTQILLNISNFCKNASIVPHVPNLIFIAAVIGVGVFFLLRYIRTPNGKYQYHSILLRLPVVKVVILKVAIARFSRTFASLMSAGVSVLDALEVTGKAIGNKVIEAELKAAAEEVRNGKQLSQPLSESKHFPTIVSQMLAVGEETGQIDTVLVKIADFYEEEVAVLIDGLAAIIEPIMIIVMGAGVGLIAASVMGPIASLSKNIGNS